MELEVNRIKIYYEERGKGQPVIFLHGFPLNHSIWTPVLDLVKSDARWITPDLRGHGQSEAPGSIYKMEQFAADIRGLMDNLGIDRAVLIGHSMGGYISLAFARLYPERLAGLGLVSTQARADTPERKEARYTSAKAITGQGIGFAADSLTPKYTAVPAVREVVREIILNSPVNGVVGSLFGMAERLDAREVLPEIQVPAMVIAGEADALFPQDVMHELADRLPRARLVSIPNAGHMPMLEFPQQVAEAVDSLVEEVRRGENP
jgi:pimeloyl-ACP methyl ester carboxylesterase